MHWRSGKPYGATVAGLLWLCASSAGAQEAPDATVDELRDLSIEQLASLEVTSVSRRPEALSEAPAAIEVITAEEIHRSGVQSLPEALRLARNLEVARISAQHYAISARGFNSFQASNKLLVLIDGRSVYTPLYSGVLWDQQQMMLEDIERIEVISGPGGTLWGANAVNGVVNVITRSSSETQGGLVSAYAGSLDQRLDLRYGGTFGDNGAYRVYASAFERGAMLTTSGDDAGDEWSSGLVGFRTDWGGLSNNYMLQAEYHNLIENDNAANEGGHVLGRWRHLLRNGTNLEAQAFYSHAAASEGAVSDSLDAWDAEIQHTFSLGERHQVVWGAGYRLSDSEFVNAGSPSTLVPARRTLRTANAFIQDQIALRDDLDLTLGLKLEDHTYTDLEYMPNVRLAWRPTDDTLVWAAVSRAVRTPSRIDRELNSPGVIVPSGDFESEDLLAYELGYRMQPVASASFSISLYRHEYEGLRTLDLTPVTILPARYGNSMDGVVYGAEIWGDVDVTPDWRLSAGLTLLESNLELQSQWAIDFNGSGYDPSTQIFLRSQADLSDSLSLDLDLRAIDSIRPDVPGYIELNGRLGWRINERVELALAGYNLLDEAHPESFNEGELLEAPRSVQLSMQLRY